MRDNLEAAMPPAAEEAAAEDHPSNPNHASRGRCLRWPTWESSFEFWGSKWTVVVRISDDESQGDWLDVGDAEITDGGRRIVIQLAGAHSFMARCAPRSGSYAGLSSSGCRAWHK